MRLPLFSQRLSASGVWILHYYLFSPIWSGAIWRKTPTALYLKSLEKAASIGDKIFAKLKLAIILVVFDAVLVQLLYSQK